MAPFARYTLLSTRAVDRMLFDKEFVTKLIDTHVSGRRDHSRLIWALLTLEIWFQEYFDRGDAGVAGWFRWDDTRVTGPATSCKTSSG